MIDRQQQLYNNDETHSCIIYSNNIMHYITYTFFFFVFVSKSYRQISPAPRYTHPAASTTYADLYVYTVVEYYRNNNIGNNTNSADNNNITCDSARSDGPESLGVSADDGCILYRVMKEPTIRRILFQSIYFFIKLFQREIIPII